MANRYTLPTASFGNPFGSRLSNTLYSNPERASNIESRGAAMNADNPLPTSPNVGTAGFSRNIETGAGGRVEQIVSPYGFASTNLTPQQEEQRWLDRRNAEQAGTMPRTPEQQQALLAQMREAGAGIRQDIAQKQKEFDEKSIQRGYAFRQRLAEEKKQRALTPSFGGGVTEGMKMRGAQAAAEEERWRLAQTGRAPMSQEPISVMGLQFRRGSMGQYSPVRGIGGGPQPASFAFPTAISTTPMLDNKDEFGNDFRFSLYRPLLTS
jgi:hypothetical protein